MLILERVMKISLLNMYEVFDIKNEVVTICKYFMFTIVLYAEKVKGIVGG